EAIVLRALRLDRNERFATAEEMQLALDAFARRSGLVTSPIALSRYMRELFPDEVAGWRSAQDSGESLGDYLGRTHTRATEELAAAGEGRSAAVQRATSPAIARRSRSVRATTAIAVGVVALGAGVAMASYSRLRSRSPAPEVARSETTPGAAAPSAGG